MWITEGEIWNDSDFNFYFNCIGWRQYFIFGILLLQANLYSKLVCRERQSMHLIIIWLSLWDSLWHMVSGWLRKRNGWTYWKSSIHPSPSLPSPRHYKLPKAEIQSLFLARQQEFSNWGADAKRIPNPVLHFTSFWGILKREIIRSNSAFPTVSPLIWFSGNRDTKPTKLLPTLQL